MLKLFWFTLKLFVFILAVVWVADHPGTVTVEWLDYTITARVGFALALMAAGIVLTAYAARLYSFLRGFPATYRRYKKERRMEAGLDRLTQAYSEIAAGRPDRAEKHLNTADRILPSYMNRGLLLTLQAHIAALRGDTYRRRRLLNRLCSRKDTRVLGLRGIVEDMVQSGQYRNAYDMLEKGASPELNDAISDSRKQTWFLLSRYRLAIELQEWESVMRLLEMREMKKAMPAGKIRSDMITVLYLRADELLQSGDTPAAIELLRKAVRLDRLFVPCVNRLAAVYIEAGKLTAARTYLLRCWEKNPHPDLVYMWDRLYTRRRRKTETRLDWFRILLQKNPHALTGYIALAQAAVEEQDYSAARIALEQAEKLGDSQALYYQWADYEDKVNNDSLAVRAYLQKANTSAPEEVWFCRVTGRIYDYWRPIAPPHGSFNTIVWGVPPGGSAFATPVPVRQISTQEPPDALLLPLPEIPEIKETQAGHPGAVSEREDTEEVGRISL